MKAQAVAAGPARFPARRALRGVRRAAPLLLLVYVPTGLALLAARAQPWVVPSSLVAPLTLDGRHGWYEGLFTAVEVALWAVAAGAAATAAVRAWPGARARLLASAAVVSVVLLLDDLFQLHKPVVPRALGIPSAVVLAAEAALLGGMLLFQRRAVASTPRPAVLVVSLAFFALWITVKALPGFGGTTVLQAGAKFAGVAGWTAYWSDVALDTRRRCRRPRERGPATQSSIPVRADGRAGLDERRSTSEA